MADQSGGSAMSRGRLTREDVMRKLREQGVTSLDDLVDRGVQEASRSGDVDAEARWVLVSNKYVFVGQD